MASSARVAGVSPPPDHDQPERAGADGAARGGVLNLAGAAVAGLAGLGVAWLAARSLGQPAAGGFFAAIAGFTLVTGLAKLGTPTGLVYWIARLRAQDRPDHASACVRVATIPVAAASTVLSAGLWLAAPWLSTLLTAGPEATVTLRALAPFLPLAALADAWLAATRGWRLMRPTVALDKVLRPGLQLAVLAVAAGWSTVPAAAWPLLWAAPWLPVAILAWYAMRRIHLLSIGATEAVPVPALAGPFWRFTAPRALAQVLHLALQRVDILLVAALAGPAAAALYAVSGRFAALGQLASQAIGLAAQPRLAERLAVGDTAAAQALYRTTTAWLVLTSWPLYLLVLGFAPFYLGLFGEAYREGVAVVVTIAAAMLLATGCGTVDMLLAMAGRTSWNLLNVSLALAVLVAVCLLAVPRIGALGAACGLAAAVAVNNLLPLAQVAYALRIHPFGAATLAAAGLAAGSFGLLPMLVRFAAGDGPLAAAAALIAAAAAYAAGARRWRRLLALEALAALRPRYRQGEPHAQ